MSLNGKIAIVSAAGRGIGKGIAIALAKAGADVVVNSYGTDTTSGTVAAVEAEGAKALGFPGDITKPDVMLACVDAAIKTFGHVDILVNNVGAGPKKVRRRNRVHSAWRRCSGMHSTART